MLQILSNKEDIKIILMLVKILSNGNKYSSNQISKLIGITQASLNKYVYMLYKCGVIINVTIDASYQLIRKIDLLDHTKIVNLVKNGNIILRPIINSTNQYLLEHVKQLNAGDVCVTEYQTAGRGRRGRYWASSFGYNLCLSLYWYFNQGLTNAVELSLVVSIVIAKTINKLSGSNVKVKWPNDLYLNEKKLAGILIETIGRVGNAVHVAIGVGLNISMNCSQKNINENWINLEQAGFQIERNIIAGQIIIALRHALVKFEKYGFIQFLKYWLVLDNYLHKKVKLYCGKHTELGIVKGIDKHGAILLEQNGKNISYIGNEISLRLDN